MIRIEIKRKTLYMLLITYILGVIYLLYFSPLCGRGISRRVIQLIPLKTIIDQFRFSYGFDVFIGNIFGNIMLLYPLGLCWALLKLGTIFRKRVIFFLIISFCIELFQLIFAVGCMDIDDIWMNCLGGFWGYTTGNKILK